ncbi:hypothetical protein AGOR_G00203890 [Albula goreensis]|uniref:Putative adherens-junction anchoring domain-containing protein n=1 Tax=Albula goreensis TaxID=1534307 RepID=A0A8T3CS75_9TELE|nr:hypothetical protein AGOR_G00203890 [Albula goreensis]
MFLSPFFSFGGNEPSSGRNSPLPSRSDSRPVTPTLSMNPKHFHLPDQGVNIYRKPPIYKQHAAMAAQSKSADDIIKSAKFPAAYAPGPDQTPKIETDYWPCPPSLASLGSDGRRRSREEEEEEFLKRRQLQEEHLNKIQSGLGKLILKEEMEKELNRERYSRSVSAQRCDQQYTNCTADPNSPTSKTSSLPGYGRNGLHRPQSTDFTQYNSYGDVCGGGREFKVRTERAHVSQRTQVFPQFKACSLPCMSMYVRGHVTFSSVHIDRNAACSHLLRLHICPVQLR